MYVYLPNLLASRYIPDIYIYIYNGSYILAIDHTITHDLPPYPSLSPVHRAKRENKMVEFSYPSLHTHTIHIGTCTYTYIYVVQPPARGLHIGTLSNLSPLPSIIIIVTRKTPRGDEKFLTTRKICGTMYMYMTCTYRLDGVGWYYYPHVVCPVHHDVNTIPGGL